jgi:hypothetical protein
MTVMNSRMNPTPLISRRLPVFFAAFLFIAAGSLAADHLEGKQQALGKPERMLSGIDVSKSTVAEVIQMYGKPASKRDIPAEGVKDGTGGERNYVWERGGIRLGVWTYYHNDHESAVDAVDVWGKSPSGVNGKSGQGLTLGATMEQQRIVYGDRFFVSSTYGQQLPNGPDPKGKVKSVLLEWHDGTQMVVDYDSNGRITHMQLSAEVE